MYTDRIKATERYIEECETCKVSAALQDYLEEQKQAARQKLADLHAMRSAAATGEKR